MLTLDGKPLVLPDPHGCLAAFLGQYLPIAELAIFGANPGSVTSRNATRYDNRNAIGLPTPNWPPLPPLSLNTFCCPMGASRWGYGMFLADGTTATAIYKDATHSNLQTVQLIMDDEDENHDAFKTDVYLLPKRPVPVPDDKGNADLWLIPVVDERYWWQWESTEKNLQDADASYDWNKIFSRLSIDHDPIDNRYLVPDPTELSRQYESYGTVIDAIVLSVGLRLTRDSWTGKTKAVNTDTAAKNVESNQPFDPDDVDAVVINIPQIAGGDFSKGDGDLPAKVRLICRKSTDHHPLTGGNDILLATDKPLPGSAGSTISDAALIVHSALLADYTGMSPGSDPANNADKISDLATVIAKDYSTWQKIHIDQVFNGLNHWFPTGAENYVSWSFGTQCGGGYQCQTRVRSLPYNFFCEQQLSQDRVLMPVLSGVKTGYLLEDLNQGDFARMQVCYLDENHQLQVLQASGNPYGSTDLLPPGSGSATRDVRIEVWDTMLNVGDPAIAENTRIDVAWDEDSNAWIDIWANCNPEDVGNLPGSPSPAYGGS